MQQNHSPLISIIMPGYNPRLDYLEEAIESVLSQSYPNWELVIVNDGSSKENTEFLEQIVKQLNDKRIVTSHLDKNSGPSVARNKGIELAKGEIITFLDADDMHLPWHYEEIINNFSKNPDTLILIATCLLYVRLGKIRKINLTEIFFNLLEGREDPIALIENIKNAKVGTMPTLALRKEVFTTIHFEPSFTCYEDTDLYLQILKNKKLASSISILAKSGYLYRDYRSHNRVTNKVKLIFKSRKKIVERYKDDNSLAGNMVREQQKDSYEWRYCALFDNLINNGSKLNNLKAAFSDSYTLKDKIKILRVLISTIFTYGFLISTFGISERYLRILFGRRNNRYKTFKTLYLEHLHTCNDEKARYYAERIFKKVF